MIERAILHHNNNHSLDGPVDGTGISCDSPLLEAMAGGAREEQKQSEEDKEVLGKRRMGEEGRRSVLYHGGRHSHGGET